MDDQQKSEQLTHLVDFLLAEHEYLGDCFWRNSEVGERRVNFFITLVTAAIAALVGLTTSKQGGLRAADIYFISIFALLALLLFGIVTLLRMIRRNLVSDEYKQAMEMIRSHFRNLDERLQSYRPFTKGKSLGLVTGGLVDMVTLVNSIIAAALAALLGFSHPGWVIGLLGLIGFIVAWIVQFTYIKYRYGRARSTKANAFQITER